MQLIRFWREALILVLLAVVALLYNTATPDCPQVAVTAPVSVPVLKEEEVKKKVTKITKKPNGAVIEEITETESVSKEKSKIGTISTVPQTRHKYSVGVYLNPLDYTHIRADVGARLGDLPLEAVGGFDFKHYELSIGIRYNF